MGEQLLLLVKEIHMAREKLDICGLIATTTDIDRKCNVRTIEELTYGFLIENVTYELLKNRDPFEITT
jgi:hypothetical protein